MKYNTDTHTLTLGRKDCYCGDGTMTGHHTCSTCDGSGDGIRGGKRACKTCYGSGKIYDNSIRVTCNRCNGEWRDYEDENWCDRVDDDLVRGLPFRVTRGDREQTFMEAYIGVGLYSVTDYGDAWSRLTDSELTTKVREDVHYVQATKIARKTDDPDTLEVCDEIVIDVHPNGYTVSGAFTRGE
jgi:RecJ-like exonuclease